jgi:hypothetical protein
VVALNRAAALVAMCLLALAAARNVAHVVLKSAVLVLPKNVAHAALRSNQPHGWLLRAYALTFA